MSSGTVTTITPRIIIEECVRLGIKKDKLLAMVGLTDHCIDNPFDHIPVEKVCALWERVMGLPIDPMFGVHLAEKVPFGAYHVLDYMLATSSSPGDALARSCRSFGVMNNAFQLSLRLYRDLAALELYSPDDPYGIPRPYVEYIFTNYLVRLRFVTRMKCNPAEVHVTFGKPACTQAYDHVFMAPVRFTQTANRMIFPRHLMELPHPFADPELCELLESSARQKLRHWSNAKQSLSEVYEALAHHLENGDITLTFLAQHLGKSRRSLQREIFASGITYRELLDRIRQERALFLLDHHDLPIAEIAAKLHYSDAVTFCHAFQRWRGQSPLQYRKRKVAA
ncbi:MAG: AraC family transcriptional regulator [Candidatus Angelobacter sp.]